MMMMMMIWNVDDGDDGRDDGGPQVLYLCNSNITGIVEKPPREFNYFNLIAVQRSKGKGRRRYGACA